MNARPGRIAEVIDVPFGRPRGPEAMRSEEFHRMMDHLTGLLEP
jgi:NitT/TauT family transport system ATP-binding protein